MGRRSRTRSGTSPRTEAGPERPARGRVAGQPAPPRRVLAAYLVAALLVGVVVLLGIVLLGGSGGPVVVLGAAAVLSWLVSTWARRRLASYELSGEDRLLLLTATGILALSVLLAAVSAVLVSVK
jgi:hypothetical protein